MDSAAGDRNGLNLLHLFSMINLSLQRFGHVWINNTSLCCVLPYYTRPHYASQAVFSLETEVSILLTYTQYHTADLKL